MVAGLQSHLVSQMQGNGCDPQVELLPSHTFGFPASAVDCAECQLITLLRDSPLEQIDKAWEFVERCGRPLIHDNLAVIHARVLLVLHL